MKTKRHISLLTTALLFVAVATARADLIETAPFSLPVGPSQQTIQLPQFDPALGTLTGATITVSGSIQYVLDIFNTGPGPFSATLLDTLSFGSTPLMTGGTFSGSIPANQTVFTYSPAALSFGPLIETFGPNTAQVFAGTGTVSFNLSLPAVTVDSFSGGTIENVLAFSGAVGTVTADYMFTPAVATVPEPASMAMLGIAFCLLAVRRRK
jgi:hypothetical protein